MKRLIKTEGTNPSGVEMIHTPISFSSIGADTNVPGDYTSRLLALSTLTDVAKEVVETQEITRNHLSKLERVLFDRHDYLEYDIDYLIYLIQEYLKCTDTLSDWKMLLIANDVDLHRAFMDKATNLYKTIINKCNNCLIYKYL